MGNGRPRDSAGRYPPLAEYGLIGDRRSAALVSRQGSIDWCCLPRFDGEALFARLLDWDNGGRCSIEAREAEARQEYVDQTLVLETRLAAAGGEARILDFFARPEAENEPKIVRIVEGCEGSIGLEVCVAPRFDYGQVAPWLRGENGVFAAIGGDDGLLIRSDMGLEVRDRHRLEGEVSVGEGERLHLEIGFHPPVELDSLEGYEPLDPGKLDDSLQETLSWWHDWRTCIDEETATDELKGAVRSALVLKALSFEPTGAIAAAATTSIPEARSLSGERNWDYRFSWIRDSALSVRSLAELGCDEDADAFRRFIERSAAGHAADLQVVYGVGGERRLREFEMEGLEGYRGAAPVRVGNGATQQLQLDAFGQLVDQSWRWHRRGNSPDQDYWVFISDLVEAAVDHWQQPDRGIWEWRGEPRHFVHSKAFAWGAVDRGIRLAKDTDRACPDRWSEARDEIGAAIEADGYDEGRGIFVQAFDHHESLDAALLRLPTTGVVAWDDERMLRTTDAIRDQLGLDGLLRRYDADDGMPEEGAFLACSFWLVTCLSRQGRRDEAKEAFERTMRCSNDLGLFPEEYDPDAERMLGNFPQALTHLSHIEASLALSGATDEQLEAEQPGRA
jgi:GH15 family glucan-1,4-alpha-glucosidase